jgi:hypothetical protein
MAEEIRGGGPDQAPRPLRTNTSDHPVIPTRRGFHDSLVLPGACFTASAVATSFHQHRQLRLRGQSICIVQEDSFRSRNQ